MTKFDTNVAAIKLQILAALPEEAGVSAQYNDELTQYKFTIPHDKLNESLEAYQDRLDNIANDLDACLDPIKRGALPVDIFPESRQQQIRVICPKLRKESFTALEQVYNEAEYIAPAQSR